MHGLKGLARGTPKCRSALDGAGARADSGVGVMRSLPVTSPCSPSSFSCVLTANFFDVTGSGPDTQAPVLSKCLLDEGLVVLPEPLDAFFVVVLRDALDEILSRHIEISDPNRGSARYQMYLPFEPPFSDPALWGNPTVLAVVEEVLGPDFECIYHASDTPMHGSTYQRVHQDCSPLFADGDWHLPPYGLVMSVPLVDVNDQNGPLEWFRGRYQPDATATPERFTGPAGTVLLRDIRLWHRGTPNRSGAARPTLTLIYARKWYRCHLRLPTISRSAYQGLPELGQRLFQSAHLDPPVPPLRADGPADLE